MASITGNVRDHSGCPGFSSMPWTLLTDSGVVLLLLLESGKQPPTPLPPTHTYSVLRQLSVHSGPFGGDVEIDNASFRTSLCTVGVGTKEAHGHSGCS